LTSTTSIRSGRSCTGAAEVDGVMRVAQIWESAWYAKRFDEEILAPALEAVGAPLDAEIAVYQLEHLITT
jgi:hypothetical protein